MFDCGFTKENNWFRYRAAATYIELPGCGSAMPPEEIIDFVLDRPFLFVITKGNLPLFTGVVNNI